MFDVPDPIPRPFAEAVNMVFALEDLPVALVLSCGGGGIMMAAEGILDVQAGTDEDWRAVECARFNVDPNIKLVHAVLGGNRCDKLGRDVKPEVVLANVGKGAGGGLAKTIVWTYTESSAYFLNRRETEPYVFSFDKPTSD